MEDTRPNKRARQACEPCRRKKSRCPGERPVCSYCERLGKTCMYSSGDPDMNDNLSNQNRLLGARMEMLEEKMDSVLQKLSTSATSAQLSPAYPEFVEPSQEAVLPPTPKPWSPAQSLNITFDARIITDIGSLYLKWCHRQPFELFQSDSFVESLTSRDPELLFALGSLSLRFPPRDLSAKTEAQLEDMASKAREMVMHRISMGRVEQSTSQTLCLLGIIDITSQRTMQAELDLAIADQLVLSLSGHLGRPYSLLRESEESRLCIRTVFMLKNLFGSISPAMTLITSQAISPFGASPPAPIFESASRNDDSGDAMKYTAMLTDVWKLARAYAANRPSKDAPPPWTPSSDYSCVMQQHLKIDSQVPLKHRYECNRIQEEDPEVLQQQRDRWGPWLFLQFVYATIPCLLNHPFLLSLRLANFRHLIPHSFIQQSFEQITRHAGWICHFVDVLEEKQFGTFDPTLAHCVAIIATIHLQHSFVTTDNDLRASAQRGFQKCRNFLWRMGSVWRAVKAMAEDLEKLQKSVVATASSSSESPEAVWSIDASLLRKILIQGYSSCSTSKESAAMFGETLVQSSDASREDEPEFDLVGSVGIFGHKAVPKETPLYAPNEPVTTPLNVTYFRTQIPGSQGRLHGAMNGDISQDDWLLGPMEYGQAIETWLDSSFLS